MRPIRILYVNGGIMHRGGIESYMMNYYRHIDRSIIQIDFIVHGFDKGVYDDEIKSLGGRIYNIPVKSKDYFGNIKALKKIFNCGEYRIVHSHLDAMSMVILKTAKECGIPIRIAHSHNTQHLTNNCMKYLLNEYARKNVKKYATHLLACSEAAGRWLYGNKAYDEGKVKLVNNAIEFDKFAFNKQRRDLIRAQLGLENNFVIGHVGRFDYQKNHMFLLETFNATLKQIPNAKLLLIGEGHLEEQIKAKIKELGIKENVVLLGARSDINELLNSFDLFLLPSLFEGLPVVLIESQANGLVCIASDKITKSVDITKKTTFLPLEEDKKIWVRNISESKQKVQSREIQRKEFEEKGYSIELESRLLQDFYISLVEKGNI
ncbi:MAG TPA: glycosyltransferase family 1 protein [Lachnoclostridium phytofermentans]|uniref:Glycosyltransferase family 1 protein n=1 Tax=Lachnoclostridium phytofermentans TaxID=66219 RepID=A0A3D2X2Y1_9FIRM|nr:glycosyltransferase family 1 protein [Lachnoclostridium sp.]HCL01509.1 glycosyltransferase family 1 protein [Lachnoclostridium phytofermentans]